MTAWLVGVIIGIVVFASGAFCGAIAMASAMSEIQRDGRDDH